MADKREKTCKEVILEYINSTQGWTKKAQLYAIAEDWLAETVGRACRELEEEGLIEKSYYDGRYAKGLVRYARKGEPKPTPKIPEIEKIYDSFGRLIGVRQVSNLLVK